MSMVLDRKNKRFMLIASAEGGVNIEEVAEKTPEKFYILALILLLDFNRFMGVVLSLS